MGTRSITVVYDEYNDKPVVCMYRQFDGYPSGHGRELAEILKDRVRRLICPCPNRNP